MEGDRRPVEELSDFIVETTYSDLPSRCTETVERCFVDTVGVALGGVGTAPAVTCEKTLQGVSQGPVRLIGTEGTASLTDGILYNGTLAHALDFDDGSTAIEGHPSATMIPTILALSEVTPVTGRQAITAYAIGYETQSYLARPLKGGHKEAGWHSTATFGVFGSTAVAAAVLGCDSGEVMNALTIATSMGSGLIKNSGTMTKPLHAGKAASLGANAALLASNGFTANPEAFEGTEGFFQLYSGNSSPDRSELYDLAEYWSIVEDGVNFKRYPSCGLTHRATEASFRLRDDHDVSSTDVRRIEVVTSPKERQFLRYDVPETPLQAQYSMPYNVAVAIVDGRVDIDSFRKDKLRDSKVLSLMDKVEFRSDEDISESSGEVRIRARLNNGDTVTETQSSRPEPLSDEELHEKFRKCAGNHLSEERSEALYDVVSDLVNLDEVRAIIDGTE